MPTREPRHERIAAMMCDTALVSIDSAVEGGQIKVAGQVLCDLEPLESPFSEEACIGWEVIVETTEQDRRRFGSFFGYSAEAARWLSWYEVYRKQEILPFSIDDETGIAYVEDEFLEMTLKKETTYHVARDEGLREKIELFVAGNDPEAAQRLAAFEQLRVREGWFDLGATIGVLGSGRWEADPGGAGRRVDYRSAPMRLVILPNDDDDLLVTDDLDLLD